MPYTLSITVTVAFLAKKEKLTNKKREYAVAFLVKIDNCKFQHLNLGFLD